VVTPAPTPPHTGTALTRQREPRGRSRLQSWMKGLVGPPARPTEAGCAGVGYAKERSLTPTPCCCWSGAAQAAIVGGLRWLST